MFVINVIIPFIIFKQKSVIDWLIPFTKAIKIPIISITTTKLHIIERRAKKLEFLVRKYLSKRNTQHMSINH